MTARRPSALRAFLASEAAGGVLLVAAAALALLAANRPATADLYARALHAGIGPMPAHRWINDGLMALFFLLVGLEIKREFADGDLARADQRRLPFIAAAAGMAAPALVYLLAIGNHPVLQRGWAIPAATDIAFAIGVMAMLGKRVPASLKLLLTTIAIVDDMGAVAIIALAYTAQIHAVALAGAIAALAALYVMNRRGVRALWPYLAVGGVLWLCVLQSGVHATIAGVATAAFIPVTRTPQSPLHRLEHALSAWVAFGILPLFAFANAGVPLGRIGWSVVTQPLVAAIALGLFLGKQIGVFGGIWAAARLGIAARPGGVGWMQVYGMALLAGIGFTMSLFIGDLAFPGDAALAAQVKIGVLAGSLLSTLAGALVLRFAR